MDRRRKNKRKLLLPINVIWKSNEFGPFRSQISEELGPSEYLFSLGPVQNNEFQSQKRRLKLFPSSVKDSARSSPRFWKNWALPNIHT